MSRKSADLTYFAAEAWNHANVWVFRMRSLLRDEAEGKAVFNIVPGSQLASTPKVFHDINLIVLPDRRLSPFLVMRLHEFDFCFPKFRVRLLGQKQSEWSNTVQLWTRIHVVFHGLKTNSCTLENWTLRLCVTRCGLALGTTNWPSASWTQFGAVQTSVAPKTHDVTIGFWADDHRKLCQNLFSWLQGSSCHGVSAENNTTCIEIDELVL